MSTIDIWPERSFNGLMTNEYDKTLAQLRTLAAADANDFTPAIGVINDIGRSLLHPDPVELSELLAGIAAVRDHLEYGGEVKHNPFQALRDDKGTAYLAGALWATSDIVDAFQRRADAEAARRSARQGREVARQGILDLLHSRSTATPTDVIGFLENLNVRVAPDTISKALADLLQSEQIKVAPALPGTDRRLRHYMLASEPTWDEVTNESRARLAFDSLVESIPRDQLRSWIAEHLDASVAADVDCGHEGPGVPANGHSLH